jgi:hypothetical protein
MSQKFVLAPYGGTTYDTEAGEWHHYCSACGRWLYALTHKEILKSRLNHTRKSCLNGY